MAEVIDISGTIEITEAISAEDLLALIKEKYDGEEYSLQVIRPSSRWVSAIKTPALLGDPKSLPFIQGLIAKASRSRCTSIQLVFCISVDAPDVPQAPPLTLVAMKGDDACVLTLANKGKQFVAGYLGGMEDSD